MSTTIIIEKRKGEAEKEAAGERGEKRRRKTR